MSIMETDNTLTEPRCYYPEILRPYERPGRLPVSFEGVHSLTKQASAGECDINMIMARYQKSAVIEHFNHHQGQYGDFAGVQDYQSCLDQVHAANDMFAELPAAVRKKFENDPGVFLSFALDPDNLEQLAELGLAKVPPPREDKSSGVPSASAEGDGTEAA